MVLTKQGRWLESIGHYEHALRLDPTLAEAHNNLGIDYLQTGRLADGVIGTSPDARTQSRRRQNGV